MAKKSSVSVEAGTETEAKTPRAVLVRQRPPAFDAKRRPVVTPWEMPIGLATRKTIILVVDCVRSNPNGDPDGGGVPRTDFAGHGIISPQSLKRVIRDQLDRMEKKLYIARNTDLGETQERYSGDGTKLISECLDVRLFGGVLTQCDRKPKGSFQTTGLRSVLPINPEPVGLTRVSTHSKDKDKDGGNMGHVTIVPHAVYVGVMHFDPFAAAELQVSEDDLAAFYEALIEGWQNNRSAARPRVNLREVHVFDHASARGAEQAHVTAMRVQVKPKGEDPSCFEDYAISVNLEGMPSEMIYYGWDDGSRALLASADASGSVTAEAK